MNTGKSIGAALMVVSLAATAPSMAAQAMNPSYSTDNISGTVVRYSDLDLSKTEDVARLYARISRTARDTCVSDPAAWDGRTSLMQKCIRQTIEQAVYHINKPVLTALYVERVKQAPHG